MAEPLIDLLRAAGYDIRNWYDIVLVNSKGDDITLHYMFGEEDTLSVEYYKNGTTVGKGMDFRPSEAPAWEEIFCKYCGLDPQDTDWSVSQDTLKNIKEMETLIQNMYRRWEARLKETQND